MSQNYLGRILTAPVYDVASETALDYADNFSRRLDNHIFLKREDQQSIFSFKIRGAYNKMKGLSSHTLKKGVVAASAGNHAQGVALSAQKLGCRAIIVMPTTTPQIKVRAVEQFGAEVELVGDNYDEASAHALKLWKQRKLTLIPPYDDVDVIAGQGTIGFEILKQRNAPIDAIFVPIGGGGLIAGIAAYTKQIRPEIKIIGVEPIDAASMTASVKAGRRKNLKNVGLFADGVAVKMPGRETFRLARRLVDDFVLVSTDQMCAAIKDVFEDTRSVLEPAGALSVAGVRKYIEHTKVKNKHFVAIASGANVNFDRLRHVSERAEVGERREAILAVTIPERRDSFRAFCAALGGHGISEFNYRYTDENEAHIYVGLQIDEATNVSNLVRSLRREGYKTLDLTDNEMATLHIRHMVGGRAPQVKNERVYRFVFPERPGAIMEFLDKIAGKWNITLFHYRNLGADFGRVLCGMQVANSDKSAFHRFLKNTGYTFTDETNNPAFSLFLS